MSDTSLQPLDNAVLSPPEQELLKALHKRRWVHDPSSDRWHVLLRGEQVAIASYLMHTLKAAGVIDNFTIEDANCGVDGSNSSLRSGVLALGQDSLHNLGVEMSQAAAARHGKPRKPTIVLR